MLLAPDVRYSSVPPLDRSMNVLYSTFTVLLVAACTRLAVGAGARTPSYYLLASAVSVLCISDLLITLEGTGRLSSTIPELVAPIVFVLFGASALHPTMYRLTEPPLEDVPRLTWRRIVLLGVALMTSPAVIVWAQAQHQEVDVPVMVIGSVALAALVLARLTDLVHGQERTATTEQVLREASASLVTSTGRHMMNRSTLQAVTRLAGDAHELRVSMALVIDRGLQVVDAVGYEAENAIGTAAYLDSLEEGMAPALFRREAASFDKTAAIDLGAQADQTPRAVLVAPLVSQNELSGAIVVTTRKPLPRTTRRSIEALASTVSLALESAILTENLLRRKSERRFRVLVENSSDIVLVVAETERITFASPAATRLLGFPETAILQSYPDQWLHPADREAAAAAARPIRHRSG